MYGISKPIAVSIIAAILLSVTSWVGLIHLERSGEIEGPLVYVNGNLWMALFFSFPLSWIVLKALKNRFNISKWNALTNTLVILTGFAFCFVVLGVTFLFVHSEFGTLIDGLFLKSSD